MQTFHYSCNQLPPLNSIINRVNYAAIIVHIKGYDIQRRYKANSQAIQLSL